MEWLTEVITKHLGLLMLLQLDFSPRADDVTKIRDLWVYTFTRAIGNPNEQLDRKRINEAFLGMLHKLKKWPSPAEIIETMKPRIMEQLEYNPQEINPELGKKLINLLGKRIAGEISQEELEIQSRILRGNPDGES